MTRRQVREESRVEGHVLKAACVPRAGARQLTVVTTTDPRTRQLPHLLDAIEEIADRVRWSIDVIVVDDLDYWGEGGSPEECRRRVQVEVLHYRGSRGQLDAVALGAARAAGDAVMYIDPDMWPTASCIEEIIDALEKGAPIVHGVRACRRLSPIRRLGSWVANVLVRRATGVTTPDLASPVVAFSLSLRRDLEHMPPAVRNPRLFLYALYANSIHTVAVRDPCMSGSHYGLARLVRVFVALWRDSLRIREHFARLGSPGHKTREAQVHPEAFRRRQ